jgi:hypothetical protein
LTVTVAIALIRAFGAAFAISGAAWAVGFGTHQGVDGRREQLAQDVGAGGGESVGQHGRPVDIVGSGRPT